jgi:hypothetical protein
MPRKRNSKPKISYRKVNKITVSKHYRNPVVKVLQVSPLLKFLIDHESEGTTEELMKRFREDCGHSLEEVASLRNGQVRITFNVCKVCNVIVKGKKNEVLT